MTTNGRREKNWIAVNGARPDLPTATDLRLMRDVRNELWAVITSHPETQRSATLSIGLLCEVALNLGLRTVGIEWTRKLFTHTLGQAPTWQAAPPKR